MAPFARSTDSLGFASATGAHSSGTSSSRASRFIETTLLPKEGFPLTLSLPAPWVGGPFAEEIPDVTEQPQEFDRFLKERFDFLQQNFERIASQFPIQQGNLARRDIAGEVSSAGAINKGTGFTAARTGAGAYTVTFTTAFPATPTVVPQVAGTSGIVAIQLASSSAAGFTVVTLDTTFAATDGAFTFIATSSL